MKASNLIFLRSLSDADLIAVALKLAAKDFDTFVAFHKYDDKHVITLVFDDSQVFNLTAEQFRELETIASSNDKKVTAIKYFREVTGAGLLEAKVCVETLGNAKYLNLKHYDLVNHFAVIKDAVIKPRYAQSLGDLLRDQV